MDSFWKKITSNPSKIVLNLFYIAEDLVEYHKIPEILDNVNECPAEFFLFIQYSQVLDAIARNLSLSNL